jgi:CRISPR-associated protein Cas5
MNLDLSFLLQTPEFTSRAVMKVEALAPLSMVTNLPGAYYRGQPEPSDEMLFGLLENALGWHIGESERAALLRKFKAKHKISPSESGVGFASLLQFHLRIVNRVLPALVHYDDYWAQHLKGASFVGGSRNYDYRAIPIMNAQRAGKVTLNDTAKADKSKDKIHAFNDGDVIHLNVVRPYFPQYYASPTPRGYVLPKGAYRFVIETARELAERIGAALDSPAAPLYLGSNDGWVEAEWEAMES